MFQRHRNNPIVYINYTYLFGYYSDKVRMNDPQYCGEKPQRGVCKFLWEGTKEPEFIPWHNEPNVCATTYKEGCSANV